MVGCRLGVVEGYSARESEHLAQYLPRHLVNDDTKFIMEEIIARKNKVTITPGTLQLDCCDHPFDVNSDDGAALMGPPHGTG